MVIRNSLRVNANVLVFSEWSWNPSTFQRETLNAAWNSLVWMRICRMRHLAFDNNDCLFTFWANSEWSCERHTGLFAICCFFVSILFANVNASLRMSEFKTCIVRVRYSRCVPSKKGRASWTKRGNVFNTYNMHDNIYSPFHPLSLSWIPIRSVALGAILALHASNFVLRLIRSSLLTSPNHVLWANEWAIQQRRVDGKGREESWRMRVGIKLGCEHYHMHLPTNFKSHTIAPSPSFITEYGKLS